MPSGRAVEQARGRFGVTGRELVVVEAHDPGAEADPGTVARFTEAQERLPAGAVRHE